MSPKGLKMFVNRQRLAIAYNSPMKDALLILDDCFETPQPWCVFFQTHALAPATGQQHRSHFIQAGEASSCIRVGRTTVRGGLETVRTVHHLGGVPVPLPQQS